MSNKINDMRCPWSFGESCPCGQVSPLQQSLFRPSPHILPAPPPPPPQPPQQQHQIINCSTSGPDALSPLPDTVHLVRLFSPLHSLTSFSVTPSLPLLFPSTLLIPHSSPDPDTDFKYFSLFITFKKKNLHPIVSPFHTPPQLSKASQSFTTHPPHTQTQTHTHTHTHTHTQSCNLTCGDTLVFSYF